MKSPKLPVPDLDRRAPVMTSLGDGSINDDDDDEEKEEEEATEPGGLDRYTIRQKAENSNAEVFINHPTTLESGKTNNIGNLG